MSNLLAGFIEYIVKPAFKVCGEMLDRITSAESCAKKIWERYLTENTEKWASMEEGKAIRVEESLSSCYCCVVVVVVLLL